MAWVVANKPFLCKPGQIWRKLREFKAKKGSHARARHYGKRSKIAAAGE